MSKNLNNYLDLLNIQQRDAVKNTDGALLVLAGAGSGKTRVLTFKILHLLVEKLAFPNQILAVTFTNKAALEMKSRVTNLLNYPIDSMWLGTFHSLSAKILRKHAEIVNLKSNFVIIDSDDQLKLIKQICEREKIDINEQPPKLFLNQINGLKNKGIFYDSIPSNINKKNPEIRKIYKIYQQELVRLNCVDFGDLILYCIKIFTTDKQVCFKYQKLFKYILVDEYQDINLVQQKWLEILYIENKNICCVGDDDQSIYSWRGAEINNLLNFEKNFTKPVIVRLEQNYRSTKNILKCASSLIKKNDGRYGKNLWSDNDVGEKISIRGFWQTKEESIFVSDVVEKLLLEKKSLKEIAILFRVSAHTRSFEERFISLGLPYKIIGGLRFYERKEIKDIIAYLRLVNNPNDDLAFERIINVPKRGIGKTTIQKIHSIARLEKLSMLEASIILIQGSNNKINNEIRNFINNIKQWSNLKNKLSHIELVQLILEDSMYIAFLETEEKKSKNPENLNRLDNIKEFVESLKDFENLEGFLEHVSLVMENNTNTSDSTISLMTIHASKGLEFDYVFLAGWEEGVFPSKKSVDELGKTGLEEERRLAYVALTRARKKVYITYVNQNRYSYASHDFNLPSRFIDELDKDLVELVDSNYFANNDLIEQMNQSNDFQENYVTPGRKRLLSKIDKKEDEWEFNQDFELIENYSKSIKKGSRVFHQKYGYGNIVNFEGEKAEIKFLKSSQKKVFLKYLKIID